MKTQSFGEVTWETPAPGAFTGGNGKDAYLKLEKGDNVLRLITLPQLFTVHNYEKPDEKKEFGQRFLCSANKETGSSCPFCTIHASTKDGELKKMISPKYRYYIGVISRKLNATKILEISSSVYDKIRAYVSDPDWSDPFSYDINIKVNGGAPANYYSVIAKKQFPLSAEDQKLRDDFDVEYMKRRCVPPTVEKLKERLEKYDPNFFNMYDDLLVNTNQASATLVKGSGKVATKAKPVPVPPSDDDGDTEFPNIDD